MAIRIHLFGGIRLHLGGAPPARLGRSNAGILAFLIVAGARLHPREVLAETFWPDIDPETARRCLNTAVWRLRRLLEPPGVPRGTYLTTSAQGELGLARSDQLWIDVEHFQEVIASTLSGRIEDEVGLEAALDLYRGDALDGYYQDWAITARNRLRSLYLEGLRHQMRTRAARNDLLGAVTCGERILALDPLREDIHQDLIRFHFRAGNLSLAVRQLRICEDVMRTELGVAPHPATRSLLQVAEDVSTIPPDLAELQALLTAIKSLVGRAEAAIAALQDHPKGSDANR